MALLGIKRFLPYHLRWGAVWIISYILLSLSGCTTVESNSKAPDETTLCEVAFPECHNWKDASLYAGKEETCFVGRVSLVTEEYDPLPDVTVWTAYFDPLAPELSKENRYENTHGLIVIGVERNFDSIEGRCVATHGEVLAPVEGLTLEGRSMVFRDPNDMTFYESNNPESKPIFQQCGCSPSILR